MRMYTDSTIYSMMGFGGLCSRASSRTQQITLRSKHVLLRRLRGTETAILTGFY